MEALCAVSVQPGSHSLSESSPIPPQQTTHSLLFLSLLMWVGDTCMELRLLALRKEELQSCNFCLGCQLQQEPPKGSFLFYLSIPPTGLYEASSVVLGFKPSYQQRFHWLFRLIVGCSVENLDWGQEQGDLLLPTLPPSSVLLKSYIFISKCYHVI